MVGYEAIAPSLGTRPQWLVWRFEDNGEKKPRKVPYYAAGHRRVGEQGTAEDRSKLRTLDQAIAAAEKLHMDGVGFAFLPGDGLIGIDIDGAIDAETGEIAERARAIIDGLQLVHRVLAQREGCSHHRRRRDLDVQVEQDRPRGVLRQPVLHVHRPAVLGHA
jgi:hypothetical protein